MHIKVVKFGGSSLADSIQFKKVKNIITSDGERKFVVPSAPGKRFKDDIKVTDMLYKCYDLSAKGDKFDDEFEIIKDRFNSIIEDLKLSVSLDDEFKEIYNNLKTCPQSDYAASRGEYLNGILLASFLGYEFLDPKGLIIFDDNGSFNLEKTNALLGDKLKSMENAVIPGFYGSYEDGRIKTFSRGGSDITGSIVASAVKAELYENWKDVSGFLIADPRIIENPKTIDTVTYRELRELSYMGAPVLHEDAIFPVRTAGIPINIRNTNEPSAKGTMIVRDASYEQGKYTITGIAGKKGFSVITIEKDMMNSELGFTRKLLYVLEKNNINFEHLPSGIDTMSIIISSSMLEGKKEKLIDEIKEAVHPDHIEIEDNTALIAIVGRGMRKTRGTAGRIFSALAHNHININMIDQGSSELNIIVGVAENDFEIALKSIYDIFVNTNIW